MAAPRFILDDFWPSDLFLGGIPGAWYDPTDVNVNWRVNLLTYTEQFNNAFWSANNSVVTANSAIAPDGTLTADTLTASAANGEIVCSVAVTAGATYTLSFYARSTTGANVAAKIGNVAAVVMSSIVVTPQWQRFSVTQVASGATRFPKLSIDTNGEAVYIWGAQLEAGSTATTYQQIVTPEITYAATQTTNLFQDSAGTTPVTAVEQPVGLILDKSQGLALGPELVTNGTFDNNVTGWSAQAGDTVSWDSGNGGRLKIADTNGAGAGIAYQVINTVAGASYFVRFSSSLGTSAQTRVYVGTAVGNASMGSRVDNANVTNGTMVFVASGATAYLQFICQSTGESSFLDDISVKLLAGNHASQSTAASRPTYRARYNLLTFSEEFDNAYWTKSNTTISTNASVAPDGTTTADLQYPTTTGTDRFVWRNVVPGVNGAKYTLSAYAKAAGKNFLYFGTLGGGTVPASTMAFFDLQTGQVSQVGTYFDTVSIQSVGSGWYRCIATRNAVTAASQFPIFGVADASGSGTATTNGTDGILIWGAQLLTAADVTATGNAYQRIAAAAVYDTAPIFRPYLAFDGVDDSLSTAAINFTSTDKMTVFAGQTKLSGATTAVLAGTGTGNGSFELFAPRAVNDSQAYGFAQRTTAATEAIYGPGFPSPDVAVLTGTSNIGAPLVTLRRNGTTIASNAAAIPAGNYGTFAMVLGQRSGGGLIYNGRLYSLIVRGAASSTTEIIDTEQWVNQRTGAF